MKRLLLLVTILLLTGCTKSRTQEDINVVSNQLEEPPSIRFLYEDEDYELIQGTYSWTIEYEDGTGKTTVADSAAPPELVKNQKFDILAKNEASIKILFDDQPDRYELGIWENNELKEKVVVGEDHTFIVSGDEGSIVYELIAYWPQGNAYYAIKIDMEPEEITENQDIKPVVNQQSEVTQPAKKEDEKIIATASIEPNDSGYYFLPQTPKIIEITFSNSVDKERMTELIKERFNATVNDIRIEWQEDTKLRVIADKLEEGKYSLGLNFEFDDIQGRLKFGIQENPQLYMFDPSKRESRQLMTDVSQELPLANPILLDNLLSFQRSYDTQYDVYVVRYDLFYDLEKKEFIEYSKADEDKSIVSTEGRIYAFEGSFYQKREDYMTRVQVEENLIGIEVMDDRKISFFSSSDGHIKLSVEGDTTYELDLDLKLLSYESGPIMCQVMSVDNEHVLLDALPFERDPFYSNPSDFNLYKVNIKTGKILGSLEGFNSPLKVSEKYFLAQSSDEELYLINIDTMAYVKISEETVKSKSYECLAEDRVIYLSNNGVIYSYDIREQISSQLLTGVDSLLGLFDGKLLYTTKEGEK